jgi:hypothetical protein
MDNIIEPTIDFDFSKLYLGNPSAITGGAYFTRIFLNNKPLFIQSPKSLTKQGFVKNGKKIYTDLMFDNNDSIFINWIENLETKCQDLLYEKSSSWFETKLEKDDIENAFTSPIKIFKSGKNYLVRINVKPNIKIYNETDEIMNLDDISNDKTLISIIEIQGIKFTSRNFQIEFELKQCMIVSPDPFLETCFIKKPLKKDNEKEILKTFMENNVNEVNIIKEQPTQDIIENILEENNNSNEDNVLLTNLENIETDILENKETDLFRDLDNNQENNDNIELEIEELNNFEQNENDLKEIEINFDNDLETMALKKPNQVYYEIYKKAKDKAKLAKKTAILAYLEVKNIKKTYMLDNLIDSESDDDSIIENMSNISEEELEQEF